MEHYINITGYLKFLKEVESLQKCITHLRLQDEWMDDLNV